MVTSDSDNGKSIMKTHNERIAEIATIKLAPEDTIGATINWVLAKNPVPVDVIADRFVDEGLDPRELPPATSGMARFREICMYTHQRLHRKTKGNKREYVSTMVKHQGQDKRLTSFAYSINTTASSTEVARIVQVGTLTYDSSVDSYHWRFAADRKSRRETDEEYQDRCLAAQPGCDREDLEFFAAFAESVLSEVEIYATAPHYDVVRIREIVRDQFIAGGCYPLSSRGGFWFAPRVGENGPMQHAERVMRAIEALDPGNRFMLLTMPKDASTMETAAAVVEDGLMARIGEIERAIDGLTQTRAGQHDSRIAELIDVAQRADLYREILGLATDSLQQRIDSIRAVIAEQTARFEAERAEVLLAREAAKAAPVDPAKPSLAVFARSTKRQIRDAVQSAADRGQTVAVFGDLRLHVESDPALGYTFSVEGPDGETMRTGAASTLRGCIDAIRALRD